VSIRRADVRNLVVANVDLKACRFHGAHNLPELRVEGETFMPIVPGPLLTSRRTLAEEHEWRA
jgi:hypothetical protein